MKTIILNPTQPTLADLFSRLRHECLSNEMGDGAYEVTNYRESYPDESELAFSTFKVNEDTDPEFIQSILDGILPDEAKDQDHVIFIRSQETLEMHYNDATITLIYHATGQY